jgi:UPF0755 protein
LTPGARPEETKLNKGCFRSLVVLGLALLLVFGVGGFLLWESLTPYQGYANEVFLEFERGTSTRQLADMLEEKGIIRSRYLFLLWRAMHPKTALQAGEYYFDRPLAPGDVFNKIRRGDIYYQQITVPEGSNLFEIADLLKGLRSFKPEEFVKAAADPAMIRDLDPHAPTLEGYLFPSTYRVTRKTTGQDLCRMMTEEFRRQWRRLTAEASGIDVHRVVTLASMVEKETAVASERPLIAAVFENRLRRNMPLQCDPTVVYAALRHNRYRGTIFRSDLANSDPYNTYIHTGLPPGPIANPGIESLRAALHPAKADYLYFVAKPGAIGHHTFSSTLGEHESAVKAYRGQAVH